MAKGIIGTKVGMTQIFVEDGTSIPVTVVLATPGTVIGKLTPEKNAYSAIKVGFNPVEEKKLNKPELGVFKKAGQPAMGIIREFRLSPEEVEAFNIGDQIKVDMFRVGQFVDVTGTTKGRGFAGVFKRWGMKGAARDATSSHEHHRHVGSIGQRKSPGKVWKGKRLPGHYGVDRVTIQNLQVVGVDTENNLLLIRGAIPGHREALVSIKPSVKGKADKPISQPPIEEGADKKKAAKKK